MNTPNKPVSPVIVKKFGESTNKPMYQVRGMDHWYSSPTIALDTYNRIQKFIAAGGWKNYANNHGNKRK